MLQYMYIKTPKSMWVDKSKMVSGDVSVYRRDICVHVITALCCPDNCIWCGRTVWCISLPSHQMWMPTISPYHLYHNQIIIFWLPLPPPTLCQYNKFLSQVCAVIRSIWMSVTRVRDQHSEANMPGLECFMFISDSTIIKHCGIWDIEYSKTRFWSGLQGLLG